MAFVKLAGGIALATLLSSPIAAAPSKTPEKSVVVPDGEEPFRVEANELVRIVSGGIAGTEVTAEVKGPAKLTRKGSVRRLIGGRQAFGASETEFEIEPTGKGKVTVVVTAKSPTSSSPETKTYVFAVD
jgi:hypothetical protein